MKTASPPSASRLPDAPMHGWYEVFDNEDVRFVTRQQATHLGVLAMTLLGVTLTAAAVVLEGLVSPWLMLVVLPSIWLGALVWSVYRLQTLRRVVWCVKISDRHVIGYTYHRRRITLDWVDIDHIELAPHGLRIQGPDEVQLEIPHLFPDFGPLSHSLIRHADVYETPVTIDGTPWQELDVYALFPDLKTPTPPASGLN